MGAEEGGGGIRFILVEKRRKGIAYRIKVLHPPVVIVIVFLVLLISIVLVYPAATPVDLIELGRFLGAQAHPLHARPALRALADLEPVDAGHIHVPSGALLAAVRVGVDEGGRTWVRPCGGAPRERTAGWGGWFPEGCGRELAVGLEEEVGEGCAEECA